MHRKTNTSMKSTLVSVRIKPEQTRFLEEKRKQGISASFIMRKALDAWMAINYGEQYNNNQELKS